MVTLSCDTDSPDPGACGLAVVFSVAEIVLAACCPSVLSVAWRACVSSSFFLVVAFRVAVLVLVLGHHLSRPRVPVVQLAGTTRCQQLSRYRLVLDNRVGCTYSFVTSTCQMGSRVVKNGRYW